MTTLKRRRSPCRMQRGGRADYGGQRMAAVVAATMLALLCLGQTASATLTLTGDFVQLPIDDGGQPGRFMGTGNTQGAKFNAAGTGGASGVDFWVWGTPIYNYVVAVGGTTFKSNGIGWATGPTITETGGGTLRQAVIRGEPVAGLHFERVVTLQETARVIVIRDTLRNATGATLTQVATLDTADPDQDVVCCGTLLTQNDVVDGLGTADLVLATGATSGLTVGFGSPDPRRVADASGFNNTNPYPIIVAPQDPNGAAADMSINLAMNYGTLASEAEASAMWFIVFDASKSAAIASYQAAIPTCGDGSVEPGEECDDGNTSPGDGCGTTCHVETCWTCTGIAPSVCSPDASGVACPGDGNDCTLDVCDGAGSCGHPAAPVGSPCPTDGNVCTLDQCDGAGSCSHPATPLGTACADDGNPCTLDECNGAGACVHVGSPGLVGTACADDGNGCTLDQCNAAGACTHVAAPSGTPCNDDGNACTLDACNAVGGCVRGESVVCPTPDCAEPGECDPSSGACVGCPPGYTAGGGGCQKTYPIDLAALDNLANGCFPGHGRSDCVNPFGFHWLDTGEASVGPVVRVDIRLEAGIECSQITHQVSLNGTPVGSYSHAGLCSCASVHAPKLLAGIDTTAYVKGGPNAVSISSVSCDGLSADADGYYAVVTVAYQSPGLAPWPAGAACSSDGNPCTLDHCDGAGTCVHPAGNAGTLCRAAVGECDVAESCDGVSTTCPANTFVPDGTPCLGGNDNACLNACSAGLCDPEVLGACCGNGILEAGEECDDGNQRGGDQCSAACGIELDHFQCYASRAVERQAPIDPVGLVDQFGSSTQRVVKPVMLCAPTSKSGEDPGAPHHAEYLTAYAIKPVPGQPKFQPVRNQRVVNQFGTIFVDAVRPLRMLVPTSAGLESPPVPPVVPAVDHFACYRVVRTRGTAKFVPRTVTLEDVFGAEVVDVRQPTMLCAPASKNGEAPGAAGHLAHLMCYRIRKPFKPVRGVFTDNQFGPGRLDVTRRRELCVPSVKNP